MFYDTGDILKAVSYMSRKMLFPCWKDVMNTKILKNLGISTGVSRVYVYQFTDDFHAKMLWRWCEEDFKSNVTEIDLTGCEDMIEPMRNLQAVSHCKDDPDTPDALKKIMSHLTIESILVVPLIDEFGELWGFIGFSTKDCRRWCDESISAIKSAAGSLAGALIRERQMNEIKDYRDQLAQEINVIAELSPVGLIRSKFDGELLYTNDTWHDLTWNSINKNLFEYIDEECRDAFQSTWNTFMYDCDNTLTVETKISGKWFLAQFKRVSKEWGIVGTITDITHKKTIVEELKKLRG